MPSPLPSLIRSEVAALNATEGKKRHSKNSSWVVHNAFIPSPPLQSVAWRDDAEHARVAPLVPPPRVRDSRNLGREETSCRVCSYRRCKKHFWPPLCADTTLILPFSYFVTVQRFLACSPQLPPYLSIRELSQIYIATPPS